MRYAFCIAETIVGCITARLFWLHQQGMELSSDSFTTSYYLVYLVAWISLGVITFNIRRLFPNLARIGWWTFGLGPLLASFLPAIN
jgi:hypothetical protein